MKQHLVILALLIFSINSFAQECKFATAEYDDMSDKYILITRSHIINNRLIGSKSISFTFAYIDNPQIDDNTALFVQLGMNGKKSLLVNEGDEFIMKLNNGDRIVLNAATMKRTKFESGGGSSFSKVTSGYFMTDEMLYAIKDIGIAKVRMHTAEKYYDSKVSDKDNLKLQQIITCYLKYKPR